MVLRGAARTGAALGVLPHEHQRGHHRNSRWRATGAVDPCPARRSYRSRTRRRQRVVSSRRSNGVRGAVGTENATVQRQRAARDRTRPRGRQLRLSVRRGAAGTSRQPDAPCDQPARRNALAMQRRRAVRGRRREGRAASVRHDAVRRKRADSTGRSERPRDQRSTPVRRCSASRDDHRDLQRATCRRAVRRVGPRNAALRPAPLRVARRRARVVDGSDDPAQRRALVVRVPARRRTDSRRPRVL